MIKEALFGMNPYMKIFLKIISIVLSIMLVIGVLPMTIISQAEGADYTVDSKVSSLMSDYNSKFAAMENEIDANIAEKRYLFLKSLS